MGWKSTMDITRSEALAEIMKRLLGAKNRDLADVLEILVDGEDCCQDFLYGHNFTIVPEDAENDGKQLDV